MSTQQHILLVEDEHELALMMASLLESHGFSTHTCFSGREALLRYTPKNTDLLITDLKMPGLSGFELILKIKEINPDQKIMVTSGVRPREAAQPVPLATMVFISKPFSSARFLESVSTAFGKQTRKGPFPKTLIRRDLMIICSLDGSSFVFEFHSKSDKGSIYLQKGVVVHAQTLSKQGKEAFYEILSWENGKDMIVPIKEPFRLITISETLNTLLERMTS